MSLLSRLVLPKNILHTYIIVLSVSRDRFQQYIIYFRCPMLIYKFCRRKHTHTHIHSHAENHVWREPRKSNGNSAVTTNFGKYVLNDWPNCNSEGNEFFFLTKMRDISTLIHFYKPIRLLFVWKSILFTLRYHGQKAQILILN